MIRKGFLRPQKVSVNIEIEMPPVFVFMGRGMILNMVNITHSKEELKKLLTKKVKQDLEKSIRGLMKMREMPVLQHIKQLTVIVMKNA